MAFRVHLEQLRGVDVRVALRRAQARVAEQFLDHTQVGAALQQVRGEGVAQRVRADPPARAAGSHVAPHEAIDASRRQPPTAEVQEQRITPPLTVRLKADITGTSAAAVSVAARSGVSGCSRSCRDQRLPILEVLAHRLRRAGVERHDPLLAALTEHAHHLRAEIDVVHVEPGELAEAEAGRVEQFEDRAVAANQDDVADRRLDQRRHLVLRQVRRHADVALRRRDERARIVVDQTFAAEVAEEGARGGQLARRGCAREPLLVEIAEETAQRETVELSGCELAHVDAGRRGRVREKLRQIAVVGAHGVRRRVAVKREMLQERFEMCGHGPTAPDRRARAPRALRCAPSCL